MAHVEFQKGLLTGYAMANGGGGFGGQGFGGL